ncbi:bifunctional hydroxymethylpyrimidine kinase/phosphomethylpyrimidine kinase [Arcanobacterium bovis]|uniref:Bifunctional hydroxymethylpyrimidine kinase/phosphomethylpyrimidine kinase n=2 Tax=Arcanobacterium bovis TaxID=2529275 RepID=A0A4Q9V293_9ACTO|nr:bifunctional hydroxymethylpyrimidine kinase/phosphomethylpyrimidine kinase [Arcanobacterium bovis]
MGVPRVLSIAGTDPTGGAGAQADIKAIQAAGGYAMSAITAVVSQNTCGVRDVFFPPSHVLAAQLNAISDDVEIDAVKIGMLGRRDYCEVVDQWLHEQNSPIVVLDPVMVATSGDVLTDSHNIIALRNLLPQAMYLTPNIPELEILCGMGRGAITSTQTAINAAQKLSTTTGAHVVVKGGHLSEPMVTNCIVDGSEVLAISKAPRIDTTATHGTGCSMSSALATRLAGGETPAQALEWVTSWLEESISNGEALAVGRGCGPIDHGHRARAPEIQVTERSLVSEASQTLNI